jgi:putative ABC transport system permease protein
MKHARPPRWIDQILLWYCKEEYAGEIIGDLREIYDEELKKGKAYANTKYLINALLFLRIYNARALAGQKQQNFYIMNGHYFKSAFRNFNRHRLFTLANLSGLAVSIAISFLIFLHVDQELNYEKAYPKHEQLYRLATYRWAKSAPRQAEEFKKYFPQVKNTCRFIESGSDVMVRLQENEQSIIAENVYAADSSVIDMFDIRINAGNKKDALIRPGTIIISSTLSQRLFTDVSPIGQVIHINDGDPLEITAVFEDLPRHSHIKADIFKTVHDFYKQVPTEWLEWRTWMAMYTYVQIDGEMDIKYVQDHLATFQEEYVLWEDSEEHWQSYLAEGNGFELMPIADIHLNSDRIQEMGPNSNGAYVYIFIILAVFILIIACVNFINIFVTLSINRIREVGVRKVMGAHPNQLVQQFLSEAYLIVFGAGITALLLCYFAIPAYNSIADLTISPTELFSPDYLTALFLLCLLIGFLSGAYPAWKVSRFRITSALAPQHRVKTGIDLFRKGLIVFQFVLSLFIIISTGAIHQQMVFINQKELGFDAEHILSVRLHGNLREAVIAQKDLVYQNLKSSPDILEAGLTSNLVGEQLSVESLRLGSAAPDSWTRANYVRTDENYLKVMGIQLIDGRDFRKKQDSVPAYLVNQKMAQYWEKENPVGEQAFNDLRESKGQVIGLVKDMHYYTLHQDIEPLVIKLEPESANHLLIKLTGTNIPRTVEWIETELQKLAPGTPIQYRFIDDNLAELYRNENNMNRVFTSFSAVAVFISFIGLLGLAAIEVQRRTKEFGIRKVLGATAPSILLILSRQFVIMAAIAILIAIPLSHLAISHWLDNFMYHISMNLWMFFVPMVLFLSMCFFTVFLQALKILRNNPSDAIQYE